MSVYPHSWSIIHKHEEVEATQMFPDGWMEKLNVVFNIKQKPGPLHILKKAGNSDACYSMDEL